MSRQLIASISFLSLALSMAVAAESQSINFPLHPDTSSLFLLSAVHPTDVRHQESPGVRSGVAGIQDVTDQSPSCATSLIFDLGNLNHYLALRQVPDSPITELYALIHSVAVVRKFDIDSTLEYTETSLPIWNALPWVASDVDLDGSIDLVLQRSDTLFIRSSPDWTVRSAFEFPGMDVVMFPVAVNVDEDEYFEIFLTPNGLWYDAQAALVDYDPRTDSFFVASIITAPSGTVGQSAVGDFDNDGRMEFIVGNDFGYGLFEWVNASLSYVGAVGSPGDGNSFCASAVRPGPCGQLRALLGFSSPVTGVYKYELLSAVGDNSFELMHAFAESTSATGVPPNSGADADCDGLDELIMWFPPLSRVWDWDAPTSDFVLRCDDVTGIEAFWQWHPVDLDRNGAAEWGAMNSADHFKVWRQEPCLECNTSGHCMPLPPCGCVHHGDPSGDGVSADVVDLILAVGVAFRAAPAESDPASCCPVVKTDLDCDGLTTVVDVVKMIELAFRNGDPVQVLCQPCPRV